MNLSRINLNLLVVLDTLLREKHVTKASKQLNVTQSTVSAALNQLRELFDDELLVREKNQMILTPKAQRLAPKVNTALQQLKNNIFDETDFDPSSAKLTFTLAMHDYVECLLLPELNGYLSRYAPGIKCVVKHADTLGEHLFMQPNLIDLGIGLLTAKANHLSSEKLFEENYVCVGNAENPLLKKPLKLESYLKAEHLSLTDPDNKQQDITDHALSQIGKQRNVILNVTHISAAFYILMNSALLAVVPLTLASKAKSLLNLAYQKLPFKAPNITVYQAWHSQFDNDKAHQWFRNTVKTILQDRLQHELAAHIKHKPAK